MTDSPDDIRSPHPWTDDTHNPIEPVSAEDALGQAKAFKAFAEKLNGQTNATDLDQLKVDRADRDARTYALLSIAESLIVLTHEIRKLNSGDRPGDSW